MRGPRVGAVVIGRNEGERLVRCLASLADEVDRIIYVDSGSTDASDARAREAGADVISLDAALPFTAARARNAGFDELKTDAQPPDYVQFLDGDCEMQPGWMATATAFLNDRPDVAVVCGRRRERHPEASIWNRLIDIEWNTPVGDTKACGGDALMRVDALEEAGGFNPNLIAGEEPELCVRLRQAGWKIWRLDNEMTLHDAAMTRASQWWRRTRRAGYAYAEGAAMHGAPPERHRVAETRRALLWGAGIPLAAGLGSLASPWALLILSAWPGQMLRLALSGMPPSRSVFLTLGKLPEALGVAEYWWKRLRGRRAALIEYK